MNENRFRRSPRHQAFTLVEVAVALAIFVFGAIAIIRIFPPALGVIQNSGDRQVAIALNRSTLAQLENKPLAVPAAIYDARNYDINSGACSTLLGFPACDPTDSSKPNDFAGAVIGTPTQNASLPRNNSQDFEQSALERFKTVVGEGHTVPTGANPYILTAFAIDAAKGVAIYEEDTVLGAYLNEEGVLNFENAHRGATGEVMVGSSNSAPPSDYRYTTGSNINDTTFYVSYRWLEGGEVHGVVDEALNFGGDTSGATTPVRVLQGARRSNGATVSLVSGNVSLRFRRLKFALIPTSSNAYLGRIDLSGSAFTANQKVSVDYTVADWRWLLQDGAPTFTPEAPPSSTARMMPLSVKHINDELNTSLYSLLTTATTAQISSYGASTAASAPLLSVEPKTGQLIFETNGLIAPRARVSYRTLDEWTHQLSVAASSYVPYFAGATGNDDGLVGPIANKFFNPPEPWRYYVWDSANPEMIYFPPSEAGKSLMLSYNYDDSGTRKEVRGAIVIISEDTEDAPAVAADISIGGKVAVATPRLGTQGEPLDISSILSVRGIGVQARTAWLNGNKFTQSSIISYRGAKS